MIYCSYNAPKAPCIHEPQPQICLTKRVFYSLEHISCCTVFFHYTEKVIIIDVLLLTYYYKRIYYALFNSTINV